MSDDAATSNCTDASNYNHAESSEGDVYEAGLAIRRSVLGDEYVDTALARLDDIGEPMNRLVTEWCWGTVWTRPGLDRSQRSLLNLGMLAALGRGQELRIHLAGALRNGMSGDELIEVGLQVAVYCGVPAALDYNRILRSVLDDE
ncbi:MAG: carboxymuconolactone decarboxylase family protein [Acidimicrobiales bacterium]